MNGKTRETLVETLNSLIKEGYIHDFDVREDGIYCLTNKKKFSAKEFKVENTFRFEGMTDPGDSSILYAVSTKDNMKGTFVDSYGIGATDLSKEMREKLKFKLGKGTVRPEDI